jgi:hypothetical protein
MKINSKEIMGQEFELKSDNFEPKSKYSVTKELESVGAP